ncbi:MAG: hypothetical protein IJ514_02570 [Clostridia bacterium]|nr:hypothetical protein [Clostridia bacterium]
MRTEEFIAKLSEKLTDEEALLRLRGGIPLGVDERENIVLSRTREYPYGVRHTCVTGAFRTPFIKRLILALACLYEKEEVNFLVLSPKTEYGELLRLNSLDITVPFVQTKADLESAKGCIADLIKLHERERGCPKLFLVLDGLEEIDGCNQNGDLEEYRALFDTLARKDVEIISGVALMKSIFSGYPGAFVGVGNCLITTREAGKADVTYVSDDSALSLPTAITVPDGPTVNETVLLLNSLPKKGAAV